jgi:hypothetical protein
MQFGLQAPKLAGVMFHIWVVVSPMENYSEFGRDENRFSIPVLTRMTRGGLIRIFERKPMPVSLWA